jgi:signal peptidase I
VSTLVETDTRRGTSRDRSLRTSGTALLHTLVTVSSLALWYVFLAPHFLGGPTAYVVVSGASMEPTLVQDDFVIARRQNSYGRGDIVVYRIPEGETGAGGLVIHRIIGGSGEDGYFLRGDNRTTPDLWRPRHADVVGRVLVTIPGAGKTIAVLRSPWIVAAFAGYLAFLFVYLGGKELEPRDGEED